MAKEVKYTDMQLINRWFWFFVFYFVCILIIASFGLVAEF